MNRTQLIEDLSQAFTDVDLERLASRLNVEYASLPGNNRHTRAVALVETVERRDSLPALVKLVAGERPHLAAHYQAEDPLAWIDQVADWEPSVEEPLTWTWPEEITGSADRLNEEAVSWLEDSIVRRGMVEELPTWQWPDDVPVTVETASELAPGNPYRAGALVTDKTMFFGRDEERRRLRRRLQQLESSAIIGLRGIGKSSLLYYLCHHEPLATAEGLLLAYLDLSGARNQSLPGLFGSAVEGWFRQIGRLDVPAVNDVAAFVELVGGLQAAGYRPVLCLDGLERLAQWPPALQDSLYATGQALAQKGQLAFLTASARPPAELLKDQAFTSLLHQLDLGLLAETAAHDLLSAPAARRGVTAPPAIVSDLLDLCGRHPLYLQMAAFHLFNDLTASRYTRQQLHEAFTRQAQEEWRHLWRSLSPLQQAVLSVPFTADAPLVITRQYRILARLGLLVPDGDSYRFFSRGFGAWLNQALPRHLPKASGR